MQRDVGVPAGDDPDVLPGGVSALEDGDPTRLGSYELCGRLGEGGMGTVFLGRDLSGRWVAVKALHRHLARRENF